MIKSQKKNFTNVKLFNVLNIYRILLKNFIMCIFKYTMSYKESVSN